MTSQNVPVKIETKQYGLSRINKDNDSKSTIEGDHFEKETRNFMIFSFESKVMAIYLILFRMLI